MSPRPIPQGLLPHSALLKKVTGKDRWGRQETGDIPLTRVRVAGESRLEQEKKGEREDFSRTLFFDAENSRPKETAFDLGDKLVFEGHAYTVARVKACGGERLHHLEIGLV